MRKLCRKGIRGLLKQRTFLHLPDQEEFRPPESRPSWFPCRFPRKNTLWQGRSLSKPILRREAPCQPDGKQTSSSSRSVFGKTAGSLPCVSCFQEKRCHDIWYALPPYDCERGRQTRLLRKAKGQQAGWASTTRERFPRGLFVLPGFWRNGLEQTTDPCVGKQAFLAYREAGE